MEEIVKYGTVNNSLYTITKHDRNDFSIWIAGMSYPNIETASKEDISIFMEENITEGFSVRGTFADVIGTLKEYEYGGKR